VLVKTGMSLSGRLASYWASECLYRLISLTEQSFFAFRTAFSEIPE